MRISTSVIPFCVLSLLACRPTTEPKDSGLTETGLSETDDTDTNDTETDDTMGDTAADTGDTDDTDIPPVSDFEAGHFRMSALVLLDEGVGLDVDGDGQADNQFPAVLDMVKMLVPKLALSTEAFNETLANGLDTGLLILLIDANQIGSDLTYDILLGAGDGAGGVKVDDLQSYDEDGLPYGRYEGAFTDQTHILLGPSDVLIPITVFPGDPALFVPFADSVGDGDLDDPATSGILAGKIPVVSLVDDVIAPLIPEDGYNGMTKKEFLAMILSIADTDYICDQTLDDGSRAISASLSYEAIADDW